MVNNKNTGGPCVLLSLFLLPLFFTNPVLSQDISDHYASTLQENGILYYVYPLEGFKEKNGKDELSFDITYLTSNDSADVHISLYSEKDISPKKITIAYDSLEIHTQLQKVFVESHKKDWHYRYKFPLLFSDLSGIFDASTTPVINIKDSSQNVSLDMRRRKWRKQSAIVQKIIKMIDQNR